MIRKIPTLFWAYGLIACFAVAGCGDDDDEPPPAGAQPDGGADGPADTGATDTGDEVGPDAADTGPDAEPDAADGAEGGPGELDISVCDHATGGPFSLTIDNGFFPLVPGTMLVLEGDEDGVLLRVEFRVLDETEIVAGVTTRVVEEHESEDGELVEISRNYFAQAPDGTVCYFGEDVDDYEDGVVVGHDGAWRAGDGENRAGIIMPADPEVGMTYSQEVAPEVAEDRAEIVAMGEPVSVPAGDFTDTLETLESSPLDPPGETSIKIYVRGIGMVVDDDIELTEQGTVPLP